jgi:8-oxo-dGTP diphosphatase
MSGKILLTAPPLNFAPQAKVAIVLTFIEDRILLLKRIADHAQANLWCAPGGKLMDGEMPALAAIRELEEETGIKADSKSLIHLGQFFVRYSNGDFIFYLYKTYISQLIPIKINKKEHQDYGFYSVNELDTLSLTPGIKECVSLACLK